MRHLVCALLSTLLAASCASPRTPEQWSAIGVRRNPALATCPADMQRLDFAHIERVDLSAYTASADHARVRGPRYPLPHPEGADIVLRMFAPSDPHQQVMTETSSILWRADGVWRVNSVDYRSNAVPPPPAPGQPGMTMAEIEDSRRELTEGALTPELTQQLDAALADPCLALQPDVVPIQAPTLSGEVEGCYGGISGGVVEIERNGVTRRIGDGCARWRAGDIMRVVMYPRVAPSSH